MGKIPTNWLGKSSELKLHCFCLIDAYSMPKDICSEVDYNNNEKNSKICFKMMTKNLK